MQDLIGAHDEANGTHFRVWAPDHRIVEVVLDTGSHALARARDGYFSATLPGVRAGTRYGLRLDGQGPLLPDPASRRQPEGPHGPSEVVDPGAYAWHDAGWPGVRLAGQVVYEMHIGTFTPEGTWAAAAGRLPHLRDLGVTLIEMMPVNDFAGRFGWGYDGVGWWAPTRLYGTPDDLRAFVDAAHSLGLGVLLDVVYNHLGPDGNNLPAFARDYFTDRHPCEWGAALNFDGPSARGVRDFVVGNAAYRIRDFHFDGLRLDATQSLQDGSDDHIIAELTRAARAAAGGRSILVVGENEPQRADYLRPPKAGGLGLDALWNDDFHHGAKAAMTGRREAYYRDHRGAPQEFISAAKYGFLYQGQRYDWHGARRGVPGLDLEPARFVTFLQNHDQVANSTTGRRLQQLTSPSRARAMTALWLLMPGTPMLFQGQEFFASTPFLYFADHVPEIAKDVREGRRKSLQQFGSATDSAAEARLPAPDDLGTFAACRLDWDEAARNEPALALHRDLIRLRREAPFAAQRRGGLDGAVLGPEAFALRFFDEAGDDRPLRSTSGRTSRRRASPSPWSPRSRARGAGGCCGRARTRPTAGAAPRRSRPTRAGTCRATPPWCWRRPGPTDTPTTRGDWSPREAATCLAAPCHNREGDRGGAVLRRTAPRYAKRLPHETTPR